MYFLSLKILTDLHLETKSKINAIKGFWEKLRPMFMSSLNRIGS